MRKGASAIGNLLIVASLVGLALLASGLADGVVAAARALVLRGAS
jgi:hypothetical protein